MFQCKIFSGNENIFKCLVAFQKIFWKIFSCVWLYSWKYYKKHIFYLLLQFSHIFSASKQIYSFNATKNQNKNFFYSQTHLIEKERERGEERIGVNGGRRWLDQVGLGVKWSGLVIGGGQISYRWWWPDWLLRSVSSLGLWATRLVVRSRGGNDSGSGWWVVSYRSVTCSSFEFWCSLSGAFSLSLSLSLFRLLS